MISPLPFLGPVGAVRIALIDGELVVNPTLQESESDSSLDLIVVGTKDGLMMVEAGANEVPDEKLLEAFDLAHQEIRKLCEAQEELRAQAGKPKWLDSSLTDELENEHGHAMWTRIQEDGLREAARSSTRSSTRSPRRSRWRRPTRTSLRLPGAAEPAHHPSTGSGWSPARGRFGSSSRPSSERSPTPSRTRRELRSAKWGAPLRPDHRRRRASVPGRPGDRRRRPPQVKDGSRW